MKKAIIICIISLSLCLSIAASPTDAGIPPVQVHNDTKATENVDISKTDNVSPKITPNMTAVTEKSTNVNNVTSKAIDTKLVETVTVPGDTKQAVKNSTDTNKVADNKTYNGKNETTPTTSTEKSVEPAKTDKSAGDNKTTEPTTHAIIKTTEAAKVTEKPILAARGFDGGSFVGGIILTLGLLAIGFMGFKYYKNQTERNYHTL